MQYDWQIDYISVSDSLLEVDELATVDFSVVATNDSGKKRANGWVIVMPSEQILPAVNNLPCTDKDVIAALKMSLGEDAVQKIELSLASSF